MRKFLCNAPEFPSNQFTMLQVQAYISNQDKTGGKALWKEEDAEK